MTQASKCWANNLETQCLPENFLMWVNTATTYLDDSLQSLHLAIKEHQIVPLYYHLQESFHTISDA
jgi:hypothetical protein